ncbi:alanyl-tRNA synthetase [Cavenderia fasciculata]|uniref:Alanine--tRNA ligase n=1 Tax=Cavenderia fasciculata TaxID=261658 RepID=F4PWL6_CACFS|nr:alanyl-tRNA synthetase [Cavenderia fasciculata]EGG20380.1 alanyl-tRNA synthetase [Cavenderia fasciculata]|eukprot:XP_004367363.1 alanyl-tRNA synthetase [Cavenderia fasciculata]
MLMNSIISKYSNRLIQTSSSIAIRSYASSSTSTANIRSTFLNYFNENGHKKVDGSSLIPHNDSTLLFTNAGMVQFKQCFAALETPPAPMVTTAQKCVRAGGKHNDLDNVGYTARHHTFFEMLGNFSFGGYKHAKRDAIRHAWQLLTGPMGLPANRIVASVLEGDEEAADIWRTEIGLTDDRILRCGPKDNFWSMGDGAGPCGPCSELFWDRGEGNEMDGERYLEIWNLVFMQYWRDDAGNLTPLPTPCVDTGMGLERMAAVLQDKQSNYEIDLFANLIDGIKSVAEKNDSVFVGKVHADKFETSMRVIADHLRSVSFLIADGVVPSATGRGYVLRKIIRRALSYGQMIGFQQPFLHLLQPLLTSLMGDFYTQLSQRAPQIQNVIYNEEILFYQAIQRGVTYLDDLIDSNKLDEWNVFNIYSTYGLPLEISEVKARQSNINIDMDKVQQFIDETKEKSKSSWKKDQSNNNTNQILQKWKNENIKSNFVGYEKLHCTTRIKAQHFSEEDNLLYVVLEDCPFYAVSGGQIGDKGIIVTSVGNGENIYNVIDTLKPYDGVQVVVIEFDSTKQRLNQVMDDLKVDNKVDCRVDKQTRQQTAIHHTATHLLHSALRKELGENSVVQAGSYVGPESLRFDFTAVGKLSNKQITNIEQTVNQAIQQDIPLDVQEMSQGDAVKTDAIQLFSEKYGDSVRVVSVPGVSKEFCGGTHVGKTGDIQLFRIVSETSIAAGTRRIEARAGQAAATWLDSFKSTVDGLATKLGVPTNIVGKHVESLIDNKKQLEKQVSELQQQILFNSIKTHNGKIQLDGNNNNSIACSLHLLSGQSTTIDKNTLQEISKKLAKTQPNHIHILLTTEATDNKLICTVGSQLEKQEVSANADKLLKQLLTNTIKFGKGGGKIQVEIMEDSFEKLIDQKKKDRFIAEESFIFILILEIDRKMVVYRFLGGGNNSPDQQLLNEVGYLSNLTEQDKFDQLVDIIFAFLLSQKGDELLASISSYSEQHGIGENALKNIVKGTIIIPIH